MLLAVAGVAVLALAGVPIAISWSRQARLTEVVQTVESIRTAEIENRRAFGEYVGADAAPRPPHAVDAIAVPWIPTEGFEKLHWYPAGEDVRGSFRVVLTATGFVVHGACDIDGDGERALVEATEELPAHLVTPAGTY